MLAHHVDCAFLQSRIAPAPIAIPSVCHCLILVADEGIVLIDTGISRADLRGQVSRLGIGFALGMGPRRGSTTMIEHLRELDHDPGEVTDIVLTHMDLDHAGGVPDFPHATVHVSTAELQAARNRPRIGLQRDRYRPHQWGEHRRWQTYDAGSGVLANMSEAIRTDLAGGRLSLLPLQGHSAGHMGVAVELDNRTLVHAADSYVARGSIDPAGRAPVVGEKVFERLIRTHARAHARARDMLRELVADDRYVVFSSHDRQEFEALSG